MVGSNNFPKFSPPPAITIRYSCFRLGQRVTCQDVRQQGDGPDGEGVRRRRELCIYAMECHFPGCPKSRTDSTPPTNFMAIYRRKMKLGTNEVLILKFRKMRLALASACPSAPALWFSKPWNIKKSPKNGQNSGFLRFHGRSEVV